MIIKKIFSLYLHKRVVGVNKNLLGKAILRPSLNDSLFAVLLPIKFSVGR